MDGSGSRSSPRADRRVALVASVVLAAAAAIASCSGAGAREAPSARPGDRAGAGAGAAQRVAAGSPSPAAGSSAPVVISVVGTNDLHGHVDRVAVLGGFVRNLRAARDRDGGAVLLVDAGDMFQGTLESNLSEGQSVIRAYNALGYAAAALGNHEFDFGPAGPDATVRAASDDPRGALRARAREAHFPFLAANLLDAQTGRRVDWANVLASKIVDLRGIRVGIVGVLTEDTPHTTIAANFSGLRIAPLAGTIRDEARRLRTQGVKVVVVVAHAGGDCRQLDHPDDLSTCDDDEEIFEVARALEPGLVDLIVAGHSHAGVAHRVHGVPIIEAFSYGRAFGRADITVDPSGGAVQGVRIYPPKRLCAHDDASLASCTPGEYEGVPVRTDDAVLALLEPYFEQARALRDRALGVELETEIPRAYREESPLGNLFADLMRRARTDADVAIMNGGGLRARLPAGPLRYGSLFEAFPFDNRFATMRLTGAMFARVVASNLAHDRGILSISGVRAQARCQRGNLAVTLLREDGRRVRDDETLTILTSDFLATGGDGVFARAQPVIEDGPPIREAMANVLRARGGRMSARDRDLFDPARPRITYPGRRPVRCER